MSFCFKSFYSSRARLFWSVGHALLLGTSLLQALDTERLCLVMDRLVFMLFIKKIKPFSCWRVTGGISENGHDNNNPVWLGRDNYLKKAIFGFQKCLLHTAKRNYRLNMFLRRLRIWKCDLGIICEGVGRKHSRKAFPECYSASTHEEVHLSSAPRF